MININKFKITEHPECSADTKLFFDDVYKSSTRGKKQQVDVLQYGRSLLSKCAGYTQYFLSDVYTNSTQTKKAQVETVQCGRSMIEMLGVLAIVGVLSVGGIAGYSKAMEKFKINKTIDEISHIVANIRTLYAQQTNYGGFWNSDAVKMGVIPDSLKTSESWPYITNSFNGNVYVQSIQELEKFSIGYYGLSKSACVALASYDWGDRSSTGLIGVAVGSGEVSHHYQFIPSGGAAIREKGCYAYDGNGAHQISCIGQQIPLSSASSACSCRVMDAVFSYFINNINRYKLYLIKKLPIFTSLGAFNIL